MIIHDRTRGIADLAETTVKARIVQYVRFEPFAFSAITPGSFSGSEEEEFEVIRNGSRSRPIDLVPLDPIPSLYREQVGGL